MNFYKLIDKNIVKLQKLNKLSDSDIYNRCNLLKFKDIEDTINENDKLIEGIQGVLGFKEWESLIYKNGNMILMLNRFIRFVTNPRRINR